MPADNRDFQILQLKALTIYHFSTYFAKLEQTVKRIFKEKIPDINDNNKNLLYFYLAGIRQTAHIDYSSNALKTDPVSFSLSETFASFSFSQIVKIQRQNHLNSVFEFTIPSINNKTVEYDFSDCCEKLINTRNKLAHESTSISFTNKEIIEILPDSQISSRSTEWFSSLDPELMDDDTKVIFCNLVFMDQILNLLIARGDQNESETVDSE